MPHSSLLSFRAPLGGGKTYAANYFEKHFGYHRVSFADALKLEMYDALGDDNHPFWSWVKEKYGIEKPCVHL